MSAQAGAIDHATIDAYLTRIGVRRAEPDLGYLRRLQLAQPRNMPFENLSIHLGEPIRLDPELPADKIIACGRSGFCYQLNGLFAEDGRVTLSDRRLIVTSDAERTETMLHADAAVHVACQEHFGFDPDRLPIVHR